LHYYALETERERANLYLCPDCLRRRHGEKAETGIYVGIFFVFVGFLLAIFALPFSLIFGVLVVVVGVGIVVYGNYQRGQTSGELTISEAREEKEKRRVAVADSGGVDTEELYSELLTRYATRWGASQGIQLLQDEIQAFIRHGESFEEAVEKISRRQKKKA
jgi:hypothetical protein